MTFVRIMVAGLAAGLLAAAGSANAAVVTWDLFGKGTWDAPPASCIATAKSADNCNLGPTASYTVGTRKIDFAGFTYSAGATDIVENNRGSKDKGLGVLGNNDEVDLDQYIQIDIGAANFANLTNWMVKFDSIDGTEVSQLGTSVHGGELVTTMTPRVWLAFTPTSQKFYFNTAGIGPEEDTLLRGLQAETIAVPEPATIALLGLALAGLGFGRRRSVPLR